MSKNEKLIIGKPYSIIMRDGNRVMKISGNSLTIDDVKEFIDNGIITKDDVVFEDKKNVFYPPFKDVVAAIDSRFFPWEYFVYNLYAKYPSIAKSLIMREYSSISCQKTKPQKYVFLVSLADGAISSVEMSKSVTDNYAYFPTAEAAKEAYDEMIKGVNSFI